MNQQVHVLAPLCLGRRAPVAAQHEPGHHPVVDRMVLEVGDEAGDIDGGHGPTVRSDPRWMAPPH